MIRQLLWFVVCLVLSWYGMMAVHEAGHCVGAWLSGGSILSVEIPLAGFSLTRYADNPHPLLAVWAGPVFGALVATGLLGLARVLRGPIRHAALFFAGFSLLANGLYLGVGGFFSVGDCAELLRGGAALWQLALFGIAVSGLGLHTWHRMGPLRNWFGSMDAPNLPSVESRIPDG